ncbi:hypothetical protein PHAVU_010G088800 [Phaseolus vulgaris]|uniref:RING-type domain-containing protein n=1 Tax=Phaseolus vulgaris TaxID=3885 RepID=V7AN31_PHAVU|nr:hypothetical protein PHAVU_010G088800g [Phaseolus vulgaris]ESW06939.1 hypothetical protein PHAVU_010G088800g [Phaseolus vulgaris]
MDFHTDPLVAMIMFGGFHVYFLLKPITFVLPVFCSCWVLQILTSALFTCQQEFHDNDPEPGIVAATPTLSFNHEHFVSTGSTQCVICLEEFKDNEVLQITKCGHTFHIYCIHTWLKKNSTCPVCRLSVSNSSESEHVITIRYSLAESSSTLERNINTEQESSNTLERTVNTEQVCA